LEASRKSSVLVLTRNNVTYIRIV